MKKTTLFLLIMGLFVSLFAEEDIYMGMSLDELCNMEIVTAASKRPEELFEAPFSITIIKKEDIVRAGVTSIPEALRLAPGMIVRETTPGNYDVHIRGFDAATSSFLFNLPNCSIILVMVDNRIVYDYYSGGTFWENLSIDITDVERIEIVRGPAAALYGPNAVTGVINIITTHKNDEPGFHFNAHVTNNNIKNNQLNLSSEWQFKDKFYSRFSTTFQNQLRKDDQYYSWQNNQYTDIEQIGSNMFHPDSVHFPDFMDLHYPKSNISLRRLVFNFFNRYNLEDEDYISMDWGFHNSAAQKPYYNNFTTPLSYYKCNGHYINFKVDYFKFLLQFSLDHGENISNYKWASYDYINNDLSLDYRLKYKRLYVITGVSWHQSKYASCLFSENPVDQHSDIPEEKKEITSSSFSFLLDYQITDKLRLVWGSRGDHFNINDKMAQMNEMGLTYRITKKHLLRFVLSQAQRSPFMIDTYINKASRLILHLPMDSLHHTTSFTFLGNKDLDYLQNQTMELGWRWKINQKLMLDTEFFMSVLSNFPEFEYAGEQIEIIDFNGTTLYNTNIDNRFVTNEKDKVLQTGFSWSLKYKFNENFSLNVFSLIQSTADISTESDSLFFTDNSTPEEMGGFSIYYSPFERWKLNLTSYSCTKQNFFGLDLMEEDKIIVPDFINTSLNIIFDINQQNSINLYLKNINGAHKEYGYTDRIYFESFLGYTYKY